MTLHQGSCHCGKVAFEFEAEIEQVVECNCSICAQRGYLLTFISHEALNLKRGESDLSTYTFNKHAIRHRFCSTCGSGTFGEGKTPNGGEMVAINVRCVEGIDLTQIKRIPFDGRSL
ncbi:GFA family protein [Microvirga terricola]|uniref:GFA family protein n=1 Tax=Microvirga terricola TaxID=2719797 RepID=A0ABX0VAQ6_9HYPH|nr:GFA family protein [Microvirga terricola]NIX76747.1 GFA family protein [Microvirga terricola]